MLVHCELKIFGFKLDKTQLRSNLMMAAEVLGNYDEDIFLFSHILPNKTTEGLLQGFSITP